MVTISNIVVVLPLILLSLYMQVAELAVIRGILS